MKRLRQDFDKLCMAQGKSHEFRSHTSVQPFKKRAYEEEEKKTNLWIDGEHFGIDNHGNQCFMNSALQCIIAIPELHWRVERISADIFNNENIRKSHGLLDTFLKAILSLRSEQKYTGNTFGPLKAEMVKNDTYFKKGDQNDSSMFFRSLINRIETSLCSLKSEYPSIDRFRNYLTSTLLKGTMKTTFSCSNCLMDTMVNESLVFPFALVLPDQPKVKEFTLECLIEKKMNPKGFGGFYCSHCKKKGIACASQEIESLPNVVVFHLDRLTLEKKNYVKQHRFFVDYPRKMQYEKGHSSALKQFSGYSLFGIVHWSGSKKGGHYWSHSKHPMARNTWAVCSDLNVRKMKDNRFRRRKSTSAVLLFYERL